jgi:DNA-binding NtrC family response regulator
MVGYFLRVSLLSRSPAMQAVFQIIENAAETTSIVLVRGGERFG